MQPGCVGLQVMMRVAAASRACGRSLRLRASSQAYYGVDEDSKTPFFSLRGLAPPTPVS